MIETLSKCGPLFQFIHLPGESICLQFRWKESENIKQLTFLFERPVVKNKKNDLFLVKCGNVLVAMYRQLDL